MESPNNMVAFWLLPAAEERDYFTALIDLLALRFDAPRFEPHVTLFGARDLEPQRAAEALQKLPKIAPVQLTVDRIDFSDEYTKTLFVQFRRSREAQALKEAIRTATGSASDYQLNPHLSLVYKNVPAAEKAEVARSLEMPFEQATFDVVKVITGNSRISGPEDVASWRTIAELRLKK